MKRVLHPLLISVLFAFVSVADATAQSYSLSPLWSITANSPGYEWVSTNNTQRGLAYNPTTGHLLSVSRYPSTNAAVYVLDTNTGSMLGNLSTNGLFLEINFPLNMISVATDGAIYACNLTLDPTNIPTGNNGPFRIYRWANESSDPIAAYVGDPSNGDTNAVNRRFGDGFAVRGAGTSTEILASTRQGKIVARFATGDGINFIHQTISAPDLVGQPNTMTISFGAGNTFWLKPESSATNYPLQYFSYDTNSATATLIGNYFLGAIGGPLAFNTDRSLLGVVRGVSHEFRLLRLTSLGFVQQDTTWSFPTLNANLNYTGAVVFAGDKLFALESNNGIMAFQISTNALPAFQADVSVQTNQATISWPSMNGFIYELQSKSAIDEPSWNSVAAVTNGTGTNISISDAVLGAARFYRVKAE